MKSRWLVALFLLCCSCSGSDASPVDPSADPSGTSELPQHVVEPTPEMIQAAEKQCRDDDELTEGYVQAVDPNTGEKLLEYSVDCATLDE